MSSRVLISIVTYNSARYLQSCLDSISDQTFRDFSISLWDNASTDGTGEIIARNGKLFGFSHISAENIGFCAAHNRLISSADSDYILVLNPDVVLDRSFIETLVTSMDDDRSAGSATGKLWRSGNQTATKKILDSTGIYFTPNQRHFDRGSESLTADNTTPPSMFLGRRERPRSTGAPCCWTSEKATVFLTNIFLHTGKTPTSHGGRSGWGGAVCMSRKRWHTT